MITLSTSSTSSQSELQQLINAQAADLKLGHHVDHEVGTVRLEEYLPFLSNAGLTPLPRRQRHEPECPYHGRQDMRYYANAWGARCAVCESESPRRREWRQRNASKLRERTRLWRQAHKDHVRAYNREYKRRKYWEAKKYAALPKESDNNE